MQSIIIEDANWRDEFGKKLFDLQQSGQFCDVIIKTIEDARLLVHSCVLAASSPLLKGVIESALSDATLGTIMLSSDIDVNTWTHMLEFMYTGYATVPDTLVASLQSGATILKVDTLVNKCNEILPNLTKLEEGVEAVPVEAADLYSAIVQIKEDTEPVEEQSSMVTVSQDDMQVAGSIVTQHNLSEGTIVTQHDLPEGTIVTQHDLPEGTIVTQTDIDETEANFTEAQTNLGEGNVMTENVQEKVEDVQPDITEESGMEGQESMAGAQDEMDTQDYIDDVHDVESVHVETIHTVKNEGDVSYQVIMDVPGSYVETSVNMENIDSSNIARESGDIEFEFYGYTKSGRKTYRCLSCNKVVRERAEHKVAHTEMKRFRCDVEGCDKMYKRKQGLRLHKQTHQSEVSNVRHECNKCGKSYRTPHLLYKHVTVSCNADRPYTCSICNKKLKTSRQLKYHEATHSSNKPIQCTLCGKALPSEEHLRVHLTSHDNTSVKCHCGKTFITWTACKSHQQEEHGSNVIGIKQKTLAECSEQNNSISLPGQAKHECPVCKVKFKKKYQFNLHMANHSVPNLPCPICKKKFKTKQHVKSHLLSHSKPHKCDYCNGRFAQASYLNKHKSICGIRPEAELNMKFQCQQCFEVFDNSKSVKLHAEKSHGNVKCVGVLSISDDVEDEDEWCANIVNMKTVIPDAYFNCEICRAVFRMEKSLIKHEIVKHSNLEKIKCSLCCVSFISKRSLGKHQYHEHGIGNSYMCTLCDREFYNQRDLQIHQKVLHCGEVTESEVQT